MDGVTLLAEARATGLVVRADGDRLVVRGPMSAESLAGRLLRCKPELIAALEAEDVRAVLARIEAGLTAKSDRVLERYGAGDRAGADQLHAELCAIVQGEWCPAKQREARALERLGRLPTGDRFLLEDPDEEVEVNGYRRVPGGWVETEERAQRCVVHADRPLVPGDRLYCAECRSGAAAPAPRGWQCVCHATERRYRERWDDWVCAREQCGMIVPSPRERP